MKDLLLIILVMAIVCYTIHLLVGFYIKHETKKKISKTIIQSYTKEYNKQEGMARYFRQLSYLIPIYNILLVSIEVIKVNKIKDDYTLEITKYKKKKGLK